MKVPGLEPRASSVQAQRSPQMPKHVWPICRKDGFNTLGHPRALRLDPAGAFRSAAVEDWCDRHAVHLDIVLGEAHWKIGTVENAVRGVKELMTKLSHYDAELTAPEALAEAVWAFNHREIVRGFSPAQHLLGQAPDETGRFIPGGTEVHPNLLVENPTGEFERAARRRSEAEKALSEWTARQRIMRAQDSKHRPCYDYEPGELVYYWRTQDATKGRRQPGGKHGRFLGPARVLATESRRDEAGTVPPWGINLVGQRTQFAQVRTRATTTSYRARRTVGGVGLQGRRSNSMDFQGSRLGNRGGIATRTYPTKLHLQKSGTVPKTWRRRSHQLDSVYEASGL